MKAATWKARHDRRGESFRHYRAVPEPGDIRTSEAASRDGNIYQRNTAVVTKGLFENATEARRDVEFGVIPAGTLLCRLFPDEAELARNDRIVRESTAAARLYTQILTRGNDDTDELALPQYAGTLTTELLAVYAGGTFYSIGTDCQLSGNAIEWIGEAPGTAPDTGTPYTARFKALAAYVFLGQVVAASFPDASGAPMPAQYALQELKAGE